jgi:putative ABC transport system permease protein
LVHRPGLTAAIILILALGIGTSTAIFSVVGRVLVRPIPVAELNRLVVAWEIDPSRAGSLIEVSFPYFRDWRVQSRSFEDLAAFGSVNWSYEFKGPPARETVPAAFVSASFFDTLRTRPLLGRTFRPHEDEPASARVLVLSYGLWQRRFAGDPAAVGAKVTGGDEPFTIVGVMPREFDFPQGAQVWTPVGPALADVYRRDSMPPLKQRSLGVMYVLGRLKTGVTLESAQWELTGISRRLSIADTFSTTGGWGARVVPLVDHYLGASTRQALQALAAASAFVLLLAWANVAVLLLGQAIRRQTDLAVRRALGASAAHVVLHQLLDSALLALAGGAAGTLIAMGAVRAAAAFGPAGVPGLTDVSVDARGLAFALLITAVASVIVALAPAAIGARLAIAPTLRSGGAGGGLDRRGFQLTRLLVTTEVALSIVLLVGCGLMVRSLRNLLKIDLGFVPARALTFAVGFPDEKYPTTAQNRAFYRTLLERLAALPGVEAAGAVHNRPLEGPIGSDNWVSVEGQPLDWDSVSKNSLSVNWEAVTPDYFRAVGTRLVEGRPFSEYDTADASKVAIVSRSLARRGWPGESPIGKRLHTYPAKSELKDGVIVNVEWQTVVGVVEDARYRGIQNPRLDVFLPYTQVTDALYHVVVRTRGDPLALAGAVREQVRALDADAGVGELTTMQRLVDRALTPWRFASALLGGFALAALLLTATGLFAVLHHFVSGRTREIAIRMALGADPGRVRRFVLSQGLGVTALGVALGSALSLVLARSLSALLYGLDARDAWSHLAGVGLIGLVAALASLLPARRAARVDATVALRSE